MIKFIYIVSVEKKKKWKCQYLSLKEKDKEKSKSFLTYPNRVIEEVEVEVEVDGFEKKSWIKLGSKLIVELFS